MDQRQRGEENIGGYGPTALKTIDSRFNWFAAKVYQNEILGQNRAFIKPQSEEPYYFFIPKNPNDWINFEKFSLQGDSNS